MGKTHNVELSVKESRWDGMSRKPGRSLADEKRTVVRVDQLRDGLSNDVTWWA
jgi:hypothetical protein